MRKLLGMLGIALLLGAAYWWCAVDARMPDDAAYALDVGELRRLADAMPGDKPSAVRYEYVASYRFPEAMIVAGGAWTMQPMPIYAYQLQFADRTLMIDSAFDRALAKPDFLISFFDDDAYARVEQGLSDAALIVFTHEHPDHLGGFAHHPQRARLLAHAELSEAQLHDRRYRDAVGLDDAALAGYRPAPAARPYRAIAPGVVLIAAAGHTPGSQMVYVQRADGRELLFLGDVAWKIGNVDTMRERPRWVTGAVIDEDRHAVFGELKALHALRDEAPDLHLVPGHDGVTVAALEEAGLLQAGFVHAIPGGTEARP